MAERTMEELLRAPTEGEAWERFKEMLRACPHHGFTELTQVDTFYNGLNENDQDSLNAAAGGNILSKTTREGLNIIENKSKVRYSRNKSNVSRMNTTSRESVSKTDERIDKLADQLSDPVEIVSIKSFPFPQLQLKRLRKFVLLVVGLMLGSIVLIPITIKLVLVRQQGPLIPTEPSPSKGMERETEETNTDKEQTNFLRKYRLTTHPPLTSHLIRKPDVPKTSPKPKYSISFATFAPTIKNLLMNKEKLLELAKIPLNENCLAMLLKKHPKKLGDPRKFLIPSDPREPLILGRSFLRTGRALIDVYGEEITLPVYNEPSL
ncbi:hypothetical protein Tco_0624861 [Tanacetum coccineum]|uniref:Reverse transcriptase domain-containing protein n=1 Tax=Tanacetum coccineum TaxID=301880 RepID=A0ABQ4WF62_9ASTR